MSKRLLATLGIIAIVLTISVAVVQRRKGLVTTSESGRGDVYGQSYDLQKQIPPSSPGFAGEEQAGVNRGSDLAAKDSSGTPAGSRLIVKTGALSMVVKDVRSAGEAVMTYATKNGGFVVASTIAKEGLAPYGTVTVRIPAKVFDAGLKELRALGDVMSESINGQDVTEQFIDLEARLKNLRAAEEQLLSLMRRSGSIQDILAVQQQLTYTRQQIEQIQGQMKYLRESSELSTLTVNLSTDPSSLPVVDAQSNKWKPIAVAKAAMRSLLEVGKTIANGVIWLVVFVPAWLALVVLVFIAKKIIKKVSSRQE